MPHPGTFKDFMKANPHLDEATITKQINQLGPMIALVAIYVGMPHEIPDKFGALRDFAVAICETYRNPSK